MPSVSTGWVGNYLLDAPGPGPPRHNHLSKVTGPGPPSVGVNGVTGPGPPWNNYWLGVTGPGPPGCDCMPDANDPGPPVVAGTTRPSVGVNDVTGPGPPWSNCGIGLTGPGPPWYDYSLDANGRGSLWYDDDVTWRSVAAKDTSGGRLAESGWVWIFWSWNHCE